MPRRPVSGQLSATGGEENLVVLLGQKHEKGLLMCKHNREFDSIQVGGQRERVRDYLDNCPMVQLPNADGWGDCDEQDGPKGCDLRLEEFEARPHDAQHRQAGELFAPFGVKLLEGILGQEANPCAK